MTDQTLRELKKLRDEIIAEIEAHEAGAKDARLKDAERLIRECNPGLETNMPLTFGKLAKTLSERFAVPPPLTAERIEAALREIGFSYAPMTHTYLGPKEMAAALAEKLGAAKGATP
jgi:hypothetical protein